nr:hypothetical protein [Roseomonas sp. SXEYE001]
MALIDLPYAGRSRRIFAAGTLAVVPVPMAWLKNLFILNVA